MKPYYQSKQDKLAINISKRKNNYRKVDIYEKVISEAKVDDNYFETDNTLKNKRNLLDIKNQK